MLARILYWAAVVVISLALVAALLLFLESRDRPSLDAASGERTAVTQSR